MYYVSPIPPLDLTELQKICQNIGTVNLKATLTARKNLILAKEANSPSPTEKKKKKERQKKPKIK